MPGDISDGRRSWCLLGYETSSHVIHCSTPSCATELESATRKMPTGSISNKAVVNGPQSARNLLRTYEMLDVRLAIITASV